MKNDSNATNFWQKIEQSEQAIKPGNLSLINKTPDSPQVMRPQELAYQAATVLDPEVARKAGAHYTPPVIVDKMLTNSLRHFEPDPSLLNLKILDPACGSGVYILSLFERLFIILRNACSQSSKVATAQAILSKVLYACDISKESLLICERLIRLKFFELTGQELASNFALNLCCCDTLLTPSHQEPFNQGPFDLIIANPPYGLSRDEQISAEENQQLKQLYLYARNGKVNKYLLFIAKSFELLKQHGILSFVIPNSWLGIQSAENIRRLLLKDGSIESLEVLGPKAFPNLEVETVILQLKKAAHFQEIEITNQETTFNIATHYCLNSKSAEIPLVWQENSIEILQALQKNTITLSHPDSNFEPLIAIQAYCQGKGQPPQSALDVKNHIYDRDFKDGPDCLAYLDGKHLERYNLNWPGNKFLMFGRFLSEFPPIERFQGPRVLIREILGKYPLLIKACYTEDQFLYNRSILHILPKNKAAKDECLALTAILNSPLAAWWFRQKGKKTQRKLFPKLVNQDLKDFPIPINFATNCHKLAALSNLRHGLKDCEEIAKLEQQINLEVIALYAPLHSPEFAILMSLLS